ncbi:MAG: metal-dependent hydrolase [Candidatus Nanohaloarchaea archaeon]|nr:metal-dependent hydrolase [Candidatus Nanohaloarchaea archaeon]
MPSYRDHLLFGSILVLVFSYLGGSLLSYTPEAVLVSAALVLLASVFPDVDHEGSVIHQRTKAFTVVVAAAVPAVLFYPDVQTMLPLMVAAGAVAALAFAWMKPRHRTVTHTVEAAIVFSAAAGALSFLAFGTFLPAVFTFVAYYSHVLLDRVF